MCSAMLNTLFLLCLAALLAALAYATVRTGQLLRTWTPDRNLMLSWPENVLRLALILVCLLLGLTLGPGSTALGLRTADPAADVALGLACGLALSVVVGAAGWLIVQVWGTDVYNDTLMRAILPRSRWEWAGMLLVLLPAALLEELLFRALPLAGLSWLIAPRWLLWPLSVGFGLLHWPQGSWGVLGATLAGVVFGLLFLFTGSLWVPVAAHYILNVTQLLLAHATRDQPPS
jgi:membrane protease YdiL (CAAX protease family)